jgi:4-hydroxy-3-methylbut-2-enyl diphosphate reductase IspH
VVVVGGRNSANTKELTRLVGIVGKPALQIEHARDLEDPSAFEGYAVVGVTGGTSTPIEDLEAVAARIYQLAGTGDTPRRAAELARAAVTEVAESPYRTTSLDAA